MNASNFLLNKLSLDPTTQSDVNSLCNEYLTLEKRIDIKTILYLTAFSSLLGAICYWIEPKSLLLPTLFIFVALPTCLVMHIRNIIFAKAQFSESGRSLDTASFPPILLQNCSQLPELEKFTRDLARRQNGLIYQYQADGLIQKSKEFYIRNYEMNGM